MKKKILLDYLPNIKHRYGYGLPDNKNFLKDMPNKNTVHQILKELELPELAEQISLNFQDEKNPFWDNGWFPPLDALAIMGLIKKFKPKIYCEIGSGNSTKFARKAIDFFNLKTEIISIDPYPRAEIDNLADVIIRKGLEEVEINFFNSLEPNDLFFFDGSHRCFQNSDVNVFFLEILPQLNNKIIIGIHDIFLPRDYPPAWIDRYYNEQYMLSMLLLYGNVEIVFPANFCAYKYQDLCQDIVPNFKNKLCKNKKNIGGTSFWFKIKE